MDTLDSLHRVRKCLQGMNWHCSCYILDENTGRLFAFIASNTST